MEIESGYLNYAVLGIGINIKPPENGYPEEFAFKTTNLSEISHPLPDDLKNKLIAEVLTQFDRLYETLEQNDYVEEYKDCLLYTSKVSIPARIAAFASCIWRISAAVMVTALSGKVKSSSIYPLSSIIPAFNRQAAASIKPLPQIPVGLA